MYLKFIPLHRQVNVLQFLNNKSHKVPISFAEVNCEIGSIGIRSDLDWKARFFLLSPGLRKGQMVPCLRAAVLWRLPDWWSNCFQNPDFATISSGSNQHHLQHPAMAVKTWMCASYYNLNSLLRILRFPNSSALDRVFPWLPVTTKARLRHHSL